MLLLFHLFRCVSRALCSCRGHRWCVGQQWFAPQSWWGQVICVGENVACSVAPRQIARHRTAVDLNCATSFLDNFFFCSTSISPGTTGCSQEKRVRNVLSCLHFHFVDVCCWRTERSVVKEKTLLHDKKSCSVQDFRNLRNTFYDNIHRTLPEQINWSLWCHCQNLTQRPIKPWLSRNLPYQKRVM